MPVSSRTRAKPRPPKRRPPRPRPPLLRLMTILVWVDGYHGREGRWPTALSGRVVGTRGEIWKAIDNYLKRGARGLPEGSLANLLSEHRGYRNIRDLPRLTRREILRWAREHFARHGCWPTSKSGAVPGIPETWARIDDALRRGFRGLPGGSSLSRLLKPLRV